MTIEIELAKQNGIQYRLTPEGTTEMWCHDRDVQAFAEAVRAAACAELRCLEAANAELLEALKHTTVHLIAAVSLLESGGKKAAASNKIFELMLTDYKASIEQARAAIAKHGGAA